MACLGRITSSTELVTGDPTPALTRDGNRATISPLDKRKEKNKREKRDPMLSSDQRDGRGRPANCTGRGLYPINHARFKNHNYYCVNYCVGPVDSTK